MCVSFATCTTSVFTSIASDAILGKSTSPFSFKGTSCGFTNCSFSIFLASLLAFVFSANLFANDCFLDTIGTTSTLSLPNPSTACKLSVLSSINCDFPSNSSTFSAFISGVKPSVILDASIPSCSAIKSTFSLVFSLAVTISISSPASMRNFISSPSGVSVCFVGSNNVLSKSENTFIGSSWTTSSFVSVAPLPTRLFFVSTPSTMLCISSSILDSVSFHFLDNTLSLISFILLVTTFFFANNPANVALSFSFISSATEL